MAVDIKALPAFMIGLFISIMFVVKMLPDIVVAIVGTNTTTWGTTEIALYSVLSIIVVAAPVLIIYRATME
jgi:hypothetical protein